MPRLIMERVPDRIGHYGKMSVHIDGKFVDIIKSGEVKDFTIAPGSHSVRMKKMWLASKPVEFEVDEFTDKKCTCDPVANGGANYIPFIPLFAVTFMCRRSLFIEMKQQKKVEFETEFR